MGPNSNVATKLCSAELRTHAEHCAKVSPGSTQLRNHLHCNSTLNHCKILLNAHQQLLQPTEQAAFHNENIVLLGSAFADHSLTCMCQTSQLLQNAETLLELCTEAALLF